MISNIALIILAIIFSLILLSFYVLLVIAYIQQEKEICKFIESLNEHDKSVVLDYKSLIRLFPRFSKRKVFNNGKSNYKN